MASTVLYCLWLTPAVEPAQRLSDIIANLADEHGTTEFNPHMTLAAAKDKSSDGGDSGQTGSKAGKRAEADAINWLKATAASASARTFQLRMETAAVGTTRHQCVLYPSVQSGEGHETLLKLRKDCFTALEAFSSLDTQSFNSIFFPHISLMYGDMSQSEREAICSTVKKYDRDVEMAALELWKVYLDKPESSWKMIDSMDLRTDTIETPQTASKSDKAKDVEVPREMPKESEREDQAEPEDAEEDEDWETSVDNFQAKPTQGKNVVDEWEVQGNSPSGASAQSPVGEADLYAELTTENILEAYAFAPHLDPWRKEEALAAIKELGAAVQSVDGDSFLLVFRSQRKAEGALSEARHRGAAQYKLRRYQDASPSARAMPLHAIARPPRPQTTNKVANRLIRASLGPQIRQQQQQQQKPGPLAGHRSRPGETPAERAAGKGEEGDGAEAEAAGERAPPKRPDRGVYRPPGRR